jgi:hypothetical protein
VHGLEGGGAAEELVGELALALGLAVVDLVAGLAAVVWKVGLVGRRGRGRCVGVGMVAGWAGLR